MPDTQPLDLDRAICHGMDPDDADAVFFPRSDKPEAYEPAKAICRRCPVRDACLDAAMRDEGSARQAGRYGVFGGLDPRERATLARKQRREKPINHGVTGSRGYDACRKRPEGACPACRAARRAKDDRGRERAKLRMADGRARRKAEAAA